MTTLALVISLSSNVGWALSIFWRARQLRYMTDHLGYHDQILISHQEWLDQDHLRVGQLLVDLKKEASPADQAEDAG